MTSEEIPKEIGPYKIESLLQRGGMSIIYLASAPQSKEPIIIKVLIPKFLTHKEVVQRFLCEAEIIALADHPNIVKMYSHGEWASGHYIAMEFVSGISLRQYILQHPMSLKRSLEIITDIAYALCHLHAHGVIHRDLKPENILVSDSGEIKVIDFGIAQLMKDDANDDDRFSQRTIGTPIYMSPEQQENPESVSYPSDIYSLCIIAYELIIGRLSHGHVHLSLVPKGLQKILNKGLQGNPIERYQDIVDFISDINTYISSDSLQKDIRASDRLCDLSDSLVAIQKKSLPPPTIYWENVSFGTAYQTIQELSGLYGEFIELDKGRGILILGESVEASANGYFLSAKIQGMIHVLASKNFDTNVMLRTIHNELRKDPDSKPYALCCLLFDSNRNQLQFVSCGYGTLWYFPEGVPTPHQIISHNLPLGSPDLNEIIEASTTWNPGDQLLIYGTPQLNQADKEKLESIFLHGLMEYSTLTAHMLASALLRRVRLQSPSILSNYIVIKIEKEM